MYDRVNLGLRYMFPIGRWIENFDGWVPSVLPVCVSAWVIHVDVDRRSWRQPLGGRGGVIK